MRVTVEISVEELATLVKLLRKKKPTKKEQTDGGWQKLMEGIDDLEVNK